MMVVRIFEQDAPVPIVQRIETFPATFGRSPKNSVLLLHPSVSKHHAILEKVGEQMVLRNVSGTNGIVWKQSQHETILIQENTTVFFGAVRVDFLLDDSALESTHDIQVRNAQPMVGSSSQRRQFFFAASVLAVASAFWFEVYSNPLQAELGDLIAALIVSLFLTAVISFAVAIVSKIHTRRYQFFKIWIWINLGVAIAEFSRTLATLVLFYVRNPLAQNLLGYLVSALIAWTVLFPMSRILFREVRAQRRTAAVLVIVGFLLLGGSLVRWYGQKGDLNYNFFGAIGTSVQIKQNDSNNVDAALGEVAALGKKLAQEREESLAKQKDHGAR